MKNKARMVYHGVLIVQLQLEEYPAVNNHVVATSLTGGSSASNNAIRLWYVASVWSMEQPDKKQRLQCQNLSQGLVC